MPQCPQPRSHVKSSDERYQKIWLSLPLNWSNDNHFLLSLLNGFNTHTYTYTHITQIDHKRQGSVLNCLSGFTHTCIHTQTDTNTHIHLHIYTPTHIHLYTLTRTHTQTFTHIHTHIQHIPYLNTTHTHTHTHVHTTQTYIQYTYTHTVSRR